MSKKKKEPESTPRTRGETGISDEELESRRKRAPKEKADRKEYERKRAAGELTWQKKKLAKDSALPKFEKLYGILLDGNTLR
jgi:hypothetical protein